MTGKSRRAPLLVVAIVLGLLALVAVIAPMTRRGGVAAPAPSTLRLTGVVLDFTRAHPDFGPTPPTGFGHYAGSVETALLADRRPVFRTGGFAVASEWRDADGEPIAPALHGRLATAGAGVVRVLETITMTGGAFIDSFDSTAGPYGPENMGSSATVSTNAVTAGAVAIGGGCSIAGDVQVGAGGDPATVIDRVGTITGATSALSAPYAMPPIAVPPPSVVGPNRGDVWYQHDPATISESMHVDDLRISTDAVVTVSGHVTILVDGEFRTETRGVLQVLPGSSLDLYLRGPKFTVETRCLWSDPRNTRVFVLGSPEMKIQTDADFYGSIVAPDAELLVQTDADLHGSYVGRRLVMKTGGSIHADGAAGCGPGPGAPGVEGPAGTGGISSAETFAQWFRDVPGLNQSMPHEIVLADDGSGVYEIADDAFHPIDGRLLGNEGEPHNNRFTYTVRGTFTYHQCAGQFVEFEGGDGFWLFIDDELAMDLGGFAPDSRQRCALDALGLADGETYRFDLFYAQRRSDESVFRLRTNIAVSTDGYAPSITHPYD